jgi:hypothetical protein
MVDLHCGTVSAAILGSLMLIAIVSLSAIRLRSWKREPVAQANRTGPPSLAVETQSLQPQVPAPTCLPGTQETAVVGKDTRDQEIEQAVLKILAAEKSCHFQPQK